MFGRLRRRIIFVPLLIVVIASVSGGVVAAQALTGDSKNSGKDQLFDRVAEILEVDAGELKDAFEQATGELADQKIDDLLAKLVASEKLTDEQAAEIEAWLESRPESIGEITAASLGELLDGTGPTFRSVFRIGRPAISAAVLKGSITADDAAKIEAWLEEFPESLIDVGLPEVIEFFKIQVERNSNDEDPLPLTIDGLVEAGIIDQAAADAFEAWWDGRPDAANKLIPGPLQFVLPFAESFFFDGKTDGLRALPDLFGKLEGFGDLRKKFHFDEFFKGHDGHDGDGSGAFEFDFELPEGIFPFGGERFGDLFGDRHGLVIPELGEIDPENLDDLRRRLEERFENFGGSGTFEFRFNDGEPFRFEFPKLEELTPSDETEISNRAI